MMNLIKDLLLLKSKEATQEEIKTILQVEEVKDLTV